MFQNWVFFTFMIAYSLLRTTAQEISSGYIPTTNESAGINVPLFNIDEGQSDIWLLTKDSPIPARLNRAWSPETGYPGVQHVSTLRRSSYGQLARGPQSPVDALENRNENTQGNEDLFVYVPDSRLENSYQNPEAVLVQLPAELTSGFWESPRPQFMEQLTANGRKIGSAHGLDSIQFDDGNIDNRRQITSEAVLPTTEASDRLPLSTFASPKENYPVEPIQEFSQHPFFIASDGITNGTAPPISVSPSNQQDAWLSTQGRDALTSPITIPGNGKELFYEVSYDELPSTSSSASFGLTLTKDDIEILEKLGILSALNLESFELQNKTDTLEKNSQKEQETRPHLIEQGNQQLSEGSTGKYDTNLTDVVFIEVPEFLTSEYHGNIPGTDEEQVSARPIPFILSDSLLSKGNESAISENSTEAHVYNASTLTSEQIAEIFELLGISYGSNENDSLSQPIIVKTDKATSPVPETEDAKKDLKIQLTTEKPVVISFGNDSDIKTSMSTSISRSFLAVPSNSSSEKSKNSQGLVSSGRIQPRLLDSNRSAKENEVLQMISRRMSPISAQKLEILKKLKIKPRPYVFGYKQDDGNGTHQHRNETADGSGVVKGTYGYRDAFGVYRNVNYIADNNGFHAVVRTNEPGTISTSTADAVYKSELPPKAAVAQMMAYAKAKAKKVNSS
ncbi:uncharacterized protein LOC129966129 [Argiope bruennichi]|uniref:Cuticle protein 10.9 like protein n=1 Tax=Argiope bruennichi TaxID=94029 RepID=A0A8T0E7J9_ARGBR|nr:uncharacterized protein LOC129966129 [Argiope bruennichi]KAF8767753.1 Cuticle protein 10.9 like protein [Argiope bruennichi]